ncbi:hypothetical protein PF005_g10637 [Phytophthora fragariae]|uniref:Uncharacterized protein n=1 Tax=Phytophthora fragariae TaxID=53985 RepID=A0A6A3F2T7_9STRA|nr:hypothetical protein PF003_g16199 [Phytophthora fragariae]KAE8940035.1 hypothetical protein PF009_g10158 [Phytophthora fragariae]KAE8978038.1 hypothetical protein PF011_g23410 [Phytophthora fragariae]KAE9072218.1 hypothetical protein PF007_g26257 [Phytophthora fragariae]KAE9079565.1 hypothetical protein PF010_g22711 [Phytophthora fragariae]
MPNGTYAYHKELHEQAAEGFALFEGRLAKVQFDDLSKDEVTLQGRIMQIDRDYSFD